MVTYQDEPQLVVVPGTRVAWWENNDYDLYRYGGYWYIDRGGYWYRAHTYRGPFAPVRFGFVLTFVDNLLNLLVFLFRRFGRQGFVILGSQARDQFPVDFKNLRSPRSIFLTAP